MSEQPGSDSTILAKNFFAAYQRGRSAFRQQGHLATCPYADIRCGQHGQIPTFSRAFQRYWREGFEDQSYNKADRYRSI